MAQERAYWTTQERMGEMALDHMTEEAYETYQKSLAQEGAGDAETER